MNGLIDAPSVFSRISAIAEPVRARILTVLQLHELTVSELCSVFQLPQSTVSRHLKALIDEGGIVSRREGTSRFYSMPVNALDSGSRRLWLVVKEEVEAAVEEVARLDQVLAARRSKSREFFSSAASQWDRLRDELYGSGFHYRALLTLLDHEAVVGDLGCGTGRVAELVAPFVGKVIAVDAAEGMLMAARERLHDVPNVEVRRGELELLPIEDASLDAALLFLVLHHLAEPASVVKEAARVVRPGGVVVVVDMVPHEHEEYRHQMGHVWLGFAADLMTRYLEAAGLSAVRVHSLPGEARARGPALFVASARRPAAPKETQNESVGQTTARF